MDEVLASKIDAFFNKFKHQVYKKGEILIRADDNPSGIFYLKSGGVKEYCISKKGEEIVGSRTRVKIVKNKVAAPFKQTEFDIIYNEGISKEGEIVALGEKFKIIEKSGNSYFYVPEGGEKVKLGVGYDSTRTFLKENKKVSDQILKDIRKKFKEEV